MSTNTRWFLLLAAANLTALSSAPALAQTEQADAAIEEIVVTARRREETLQDVPISISAFSAERLESAGASDITALQQVTPNLTLQVARGTNSTLIAFIRGVGQQDPLWGFEPGVGLYVDDVYIARPQGAILDIYDIDRIEVLRGPQGTLYGRNTIAGVVKYVTARLPDESRLDAKLNLGNYSQRDVILSGAVKASDTLKFGASAALYRRDGFGTNTLTGAEHYDKDVNAFRASIEWQPNDALFVRLSGDKVDDNSNAKHGHREAAGAGLAATDPILSNIYDTRAGIGERNNVETLGGALLLEWKLNDTFKFKSISAYRDGKSQTVIDFDNGPSLALDVPAKYDDNQFTQELQLVYDSERLQAVGGVYYLDASAAGAFDTIVGIINTTIATAGEVKTESYAAFADVSYDFTEQFSMSFGGRYTRDKRLGAVYRQNFTGLPSPLFGNVAAVPGLLRSNYTNSRSFEEFTPRVSASFEFTQALTLYAAYSEGFKSGGFDMRGDVVLTPATRNGYNPEFVESAEIGFKGSAFDGRFTYNAAIFSSDYNGQQITRQEPTVTGAIASFVDNAGNSKIQGVELEGALKFTDAVWATYGIGYTDADFKQFRSFTVVPNPAPPPATILQPINLAPTAVFQNTPEWNANIGLNWRQSLDAGSLHYNLSAAYRSEYSMFEFRNPQVDQTESYVLLDAGVTWTHANGKLKVAAYGRNLTDEAYKIGGYLFAGATFGNVVSSFYGPPRTYTLSLGYRFN